MKTGELLAERQIVVNARSKCLLHCAPVDLVLAELNDIVSQERVEIAEPLCVEDGNLHQSIDPTGKGATV